MEERLYQMRDMMEKFHVSRDVLKYYEKKELISPRRNESGYRLYSELDILKLKKVFTMNNVGFPLQGSDAQLLSMDNELCMEKIDKVRVDTQKNITELEKRLKKLEVFETWLCESSQMINSRELKLISDLQMCCGCDRMKREYASDILIHNMYFLYRSKDGKIQIIDEVLVAPYKYCIALNEECENCLDKKIVNIPKGILRKYVGKREKLDVIINAMYEEAEKQGYYLQNNIYSRNFYTEKDGEDCIVFEIYIPIEEE